MWFETKKKDKDKNLLNWWVLTKEIQKSSLERKFQTQPLWESKFSRDFDENINGIEGFAFKRTENRSNLPPEIRFLSFHTSDLKRRDFFGEERAEIVFWNNTREREREREGGKGGGKTITTKLNEWNAWAVIFPLFPCNSLTLEITLKYYEKFKWEEVEERSPPLNDSYKSVDWMVEDRLSLFRSFYSLIPAPRFSFDRLL